MGYFPWSEIYLLAWDIYLGWEHFSFSGTFCYPFRAETFTLVQDILICHQGWDIFLGQGYFNIPQGLQYFS